MTWDKKRIEDALLNLPVVEYVVVRIGSGLIYGSASYEVIARCDLSIVSRSVSVTVCIPRDWRIRLFDIYLDDASEYPFMPHVDANGKICLVDLDSTQIDGAGDRRYGLLSECIDRTQQLLSDGMANAKRGSFITEFDSYWGRLPGCKLGRLDVSRTQSAKVITYAAINMADAHSSNRKKRRARGVRHKLDTSAKEEFSLVASETSSGFCYWGGRGTQRNGAFFCVDATECVYPPDIREGLTVEYLRHLLSLVSNKDKRRILGKCSESTALVFDINQPTGVNSLIGVLVEDGIAGDARGTYDIKDTARITPVLFERVDRQSLMARDPYSEQDYCLGHSKSISATLSDKRILLVGCGSIGGYLAEMLIKAGCVNICLVDHDVLHPNNIFRHLLGRGAVGKYKSASLATRLSEDLPGIKVRSVTQRLEDALQEGDVELNGFDTIISTTGNPNVNMFLDEELHRLGCRADVFFAWNEPLDIGCHAVYVPGRNYCGMPHLPSYSSLFVRDIDGPYDVSSYCERDQVFLKSESGCNGSFVPYSSDVSVKSALLVVSLLRQAVDDRLDSAVLVSEKGEGYYFERAGHVASTVYRNQSDLRRMVSLDHLDELVC